MSICPEILAGEYAQANRISILIQEITSSLTARDIVFTGLRQTILCECHKREFAEYLQKRHRVSPWLPDKIEAVYL